MRITNSMLTENCLTNINRNKTEMDRLNTQLATQKKIQRPSEDPITAIRALRYRYTSAEIEQYLSRNIKDAEGWLEVTEDALNDTVKLLDDVVNYFEQAANGTNDLSNRQTVIETLKNYRSQMYSDANADYSGRTIFTGYKTNDTYSFKTEDKTAAYVLTEKFTASNLEQVSVLKSNCQVSSATINSTTITGLDMTNYDNCGYEKVNRVRLAYENIDGCIPSLSYTKADGTTASVNISATKKSTDQDAYTVAAGEITFLQDTGELILGDDVYAELETSQGFSFSYAKVGFDQGDIKPEQIYNCYRIDDLLDANIGGKTVTDVLDGINAETTADKITSYFQGVGVKENVIKYTYNPNQDISYTVNFNQDLIINTKGSDVFTTDMTRDLDDAINAVSKVQDIENELKILENLKTAYADDSVEYEKITQLLDMKNQELDYANEKMQKVLEQSLTSFKGHFDRASLAKSDVGARMNRLDLSKSRLEAQKTVVTTLKTENEGVKVTDVATKYSASEAVYDASLAAAAKVIQKTLLDFI